MNARPDPDAIADTLADVATVLGRDCRTVRLAMSLDDLRRDIALALTGEPQPRRVYPDEAAVQAAGQGAGDGFRIRDLESAVFAHGGRFAAAAGLAP